NLERAHPLNELLKKFLVNFVGNNESLRCDTGLPRVDGARFDCRVQRRFEVCAWHYDECIAAAKLENTFFNFTRRSACDSRAGFFASCNSYGLDARIDDQWFHLFRLNQQRLENALFKSGAAKDFFNRQCALRY